MKFSAQKADITKALTNIKLLIDLKANKQYLKNILITANENTIEFFVTDLETQSNITIDAIVENNNSGYINCFVDFVTLQKIVKSLDKGFIDFEITLDKLLVKQNDLEFSLALQNKNEMHVFTCAKGDNLGAFDRQQLKQKIETVAHAMAAKDIRYYLNGMLLEYEEKTINFVTTDGHRAAIQTVENTTGINEKQYIIPHRFIKAFIKILGKDNGRVLITEFNSDHKKRLSITGDGFGFVVTLIDGQYPNYKRVIPDRKLKTELNRVSLLHAIEAAKSNTHAKYAGVKLELKNKVMQIEAVNEKQDVFKTAVGADFVEPLELGINAIYLIDALKAGNSERVVIEYDTGKDSIKIDGSFVVMPMRL